LNAYHVSGRAFPGVGLDKRISIVLELIMPFRLAECEQKCRYPPGADSTQDPADCVRSTILRQMARPDHGCRSISFTVVCASVGNI